MFGNSMVQQNPMRTPLNDALYTKFNAVINNLINQNKIDFNIKNVITEAFNAKINQLENTLINQYGNNGIPTQAVDTILKNFINEIYNNITISQNQNMGGWNNQNPGFPPPANSNQGFINNMGNSPGNTGYDIGIDNINTSSRIPANNDYINNLPTSSPKIISDNPILNKTNIDEKINTSKLSKLALSKDTNDYLYDASYYNCIDNIDNTKKKIFIFSGNVNNKTKVDIITNINPPSQENEKDILDHNKKIIKIYDNIITDIKIMSGLPDNKIIKLERSYLRILYPWSNSVTLLYNLYKKFLKDVDLSWYNKAIDLKVKNMIKLNIIHYDEYIPSSESVKSSVESFKIMEDDIIKPIYIKSNANYFIDFINNLLENNIRLYNKSYFTQYGQLETIDDFQEMIIAYRDNTKTLDRVDIINYYINQLKNSFYKNISKHGDTYFIKNHKTFIIDNDHVDYYGAENDFIIEIPNNYRDIIISDLFKNNKDLFEINYITNFGVYKITPIFINTNFDDFVLFYQKQ